ncbi:MAG: helix-turn-helix domain-containing protein [Candidatus Binatia bacterium]
MIPAERRAELQRSARRKLIEMDLRELRKFAGRTQVELAEATKMTQAQVSRLEKRPDHLLSTLRRYVEALGGQLEITAAFGDRSVRVRALG